MFQPVGQVPVRRPGSSPSARGATAATVPEFSAKWRRSPAFLAQVPRLSGAGPKKSWGPAPLESVGDRLAEQDSKRKTDLLRLVGGPAPEEGGLLWKKGDLRWKKGGPAPEEGDLRRKKGGPALEEGRTCSGRGGPAPEEEGPAPEEGGLLWKKGDLRRKKGGLAPLGRGTCAGRGGDLRHSPGLWV